MSSNAFLNSKLLGIPALIVSNNNFTSKAIESCFFVYSVIEFEF